MLFNSYAYGVLLFEALSFLLLSLYLMVFLLRFSPSFSTLLSYSFGKYVVATDGSVSPAVDETFYAS